MKSSTIPRPATERIPPSLKVEDDPLVETLEESTEAIEFESGRNPLLSDQDFNKFFPSWSRKKRATLIQESRLFNVTGLGFGTISYPWTDVIGNVVVGRLFMKFPDPVFLNFFLRGFAGFKLLAIFPFVTRRNLEYPKGRVNLLQCS